MSLGFIRAVEKTDREFRPLVVLDVGANKGQSTAEYVDRFPEATIHSLEPAVSTFRALSRRFAANPRIKTHNVALDREEKQVRFSAKPGSTTNSIIEGEEPPAEFDVVDCQTGDNFCARNKIGRIDLLKIDTEGYDLRVLTGFSGMLKAETIKYIQVECTTTLDNHFHVHLEKFIHFLHPFGYSLYGLFDLVRRVKKTGQKLNGVWFCNAVFVLEQRNARLRTDGFN